MCNTHQPTWPDGENPYWFCVLDTHAKLSDVLNVATSMLIEIEEYGPYFFDPCFAHHPINTSYTAVGLAGTVMVMAGYSPDVDPDTDEVVDVVRHLMAALGAISEGYYAEGIYLLVAKRQDQVMLDKFEDIRHLVLQVQSENDSDPHEDTDPWFHYIDQLAQVLREGGL